MADQSQSHTESNARRAGLARKIIVLAAALALLVAYYWVHKPLDAALVLAVGGALLDALTVLALLLAAGGIGRRALACLDTTALSSPEQLALTAGIGLGLVSGAAVLLGMAGLYRGIVLWPLLMVAALVARRDLAAWAREAGSMLRAAPPRTPWTRFLALLTGALLITAALHAFAPPHAWDALTYHLVGPGRYLAAGRITVQPDNHFLGFPQLVEVLFGMVMSLLGRDTAAAPLHLVFGGLGLLAVWGRTRRAAGESAAWLSVVLLLSAFSLWLLLGRPYVDLAAMAYGALVLVGIGQWRERRLDGWLVVTGLCLGMAVSVKYTAGGLALAALLTVIVYARRDGVPALARLTLLLAGAALLAYLPWAIKGLLLYHNPVYPYFLGGVSWDAARAQTFDGFGSGLLSKPDAWQLPVLPLAAAIFGVERGGAYAFTAGPWLLAAPLLLLAVWRSLGDRPRALARDCLWLGGPLVLFWMVLAAGSEIGQQTRLMTVALPFCAAAGALAFDGLSRWPRQPLDVRFVLQAVLAVTLLLGLAEPLRETVRVRAVPVLLGSTSRADFLAHNLGLYDQAMRHLDELPAGSQVRLVWEPRAYYCPPDTVCPPDILFDHWAYPLMAGQTPDEVLAGWQAEGDTHLLVFGRGLDFALQNDPRFRPYDALFAAAVESHLTPVWRSDPAAYTLYEWR